MTELLGSPDQELKRDVINVPWVLTGNMGHIQEQMRWVRRDIETLRFKKKKKKARNFFKM